MNGKIKFGLIHEGKVPPDYRVALTPITAQRCKEQYQEIEIYAQMSPTRCYKDEEYTQKGIEVVETVDNCDILLGVKEVPINKLIENKTYFFFSHTIKKQSYNRPLLQEILKRNITLIDYETLVDDNGKRLIGFGHFAGLVGAHHALRTYGLKKRLYNLELAHRHFNYDEMVASYKSIQFPPFKIAITGSGQVAKGAIEIMRQAGIKMVDKETFLNENLSDPCYCVFEMNDLYCNESGEFDKKEFYAHPELYKNNFLEVTHHADILINGIFWKPAIPKLFETSDIQHPNWQVKVIADVTCDPFGSVPINLGASTIADPIYGVRRDTLEQVEAFSDDDTVIDIMAVDNLPNELGRDASQYFSERFEKYILPELLKENSDIVSRAKICEKGQLTEKFSYLQDFVDATDTN